MSFPLPHMPLGGTPPTQTLAPVSGSNRLPVSPRRSAAQLTTGTPIPGLGSSIGTSSSSSSSMPPIGPVMGTLASTYQRPFSVPAYLRHASLFRDRFETVPSLNAHPSPIRDKGKGRSATRTAYRASEVLSDRSPAMSSSDDPPLPSPPPLPPILLPTCWDEADRCALLELTSDGLGVSFAGSAKYGDRDAAAVRANRPVPPQAGVYYYEVKVLDKGVSGYIGIGLSDRDVPLGRLPGWEDKSYGYHADDGRAFCSQGNGEEFGATWTTGDVVGCGIDWTDAGLPRGERERAPRQAGERGKDKDRDRDGVKGGGRVFFTKNGEFLGYAFCGLQGQLYPTVGLRTPNEAVRVNFGASPFRFDIEGLVLERKRTVLSRMVRTEPSPASLLPSPLPAIPALLPTSVAERAHETIQALISSYLVHHGYAATASAFGAQVRAERIERAQGLVPGRTPATAAAATATVHSDTAEDAGLASAAASSAVRANIRAATLAGHAEQALALLETHYPSALAHGVETDPNGGVLFRLRCRAFVEAVLALSRAGRDPAGASASLSPSYVSSCASPAGEAAATRSSSPFSNGGGLDALLSLGQALHGTYGADPRPAVREELQAVLGLMAYADPEREASGRTRELLDDPEREKVADEVNAAVLLAANLPPVPALETLYRQACATVQLAGEVGSGAAAMVDVARHVLGSSEP